MDEVRRRDDGELCGFVQQRGGQWHALVVFGAAIGTHDDRDDAERQVLNDGLAALADRWLLRRRGGVDDEVVCIVEANALGVTLARGYYSLPGVPTITISAAALAAGDWLLYR